MQLLYKGKIKNNIKIETRKQRYAHLLWEFWKHDYELFPSEIVEDRVGVGKKPHAVIFILDGSTDDVPNTDEEANFYKKVINQCRKKGYTHPFVIISKIDIVEGRLRKKLSRGLLDEKEKEFKIAEHIDGIIDNVSKKLSISREYIDFLENYTPSNQEKNLKIEYYSLKTLKKIVNEGQTFLKSQKKSFCQIF